MLQNDNKFTKLCICAHSKPAMFFSKWQRKDKNTFWVILFFTLISRCFPQQETWSLIFFSMTCIKPDTAKYASTVSDWSNLLPVYEHQQEATRPSAVGVENNV